LGLGYEQGNGNKFFKRGVFLPVGGKENNIRGIEVTANIFKGTKY
jgi:hypothetical protein